MGGLDTFLEVGLPCRRSGHLAGSPDTLWKVETLCNMSGHHMGIYLTDQDGSLVGRTSTD